MNTTEAVVERVEGGNVWIRADGRYPACGACERHKRCQGVASLLDQSAGATGQLLCLPNLIGARAGDAVLVEACDGDVGRAAWRAYGIPLLLAMAGAMAGKLSGGGDLHAGVGLLLGLLAGFFLLRRKGLDSQAFTPILSFKFKLPSRFS